MARLRPQERVVLSAVRREKVNQVQGRHMHKRFRSWSQQRMRQYWLPMKVAINADPSSMDGQYLSACVQKAASLRKHDLPLWFGYSKRLLEIGATLTPQQMAYVFYGGLIPHVVKHIDDYYSHAFMCVCWGLNRVQIRDDELFQKLAQAVISKGPQMRPADLIKICNVLSKMGIHSPSVISQLSELSIAKLESIFAQGFRNAISDVAICNIYNDKAKAYILTRFSRIFPCARPQHFQQAYKSAVAVRVLYPDVWYSLPKQVRTFYTRLSMRRIPQMTHWPSGFQWDVSNTLADIGIAHRNTFQWGCYWMDIGEVEERKNCWFVDGPSSFYTSSTVYTQTAKLHHRILHDLGWNIRRVRWDDWVELQGDKVRKRRFIESLRIGPPLGATLVDRQELSTEDFASKLEKVKMLKKIALENKLQKRRKIHITV